MLATMAILMRYVLGILWKRETYPVITRMRQEQNKIRVPMSLEVEGNLKNV